MIRFRRLIRSATVAIMLAATSIALPPVVRPVADGAASRRTAAQAATVDKPVSLAATAQGDVYVSFLTGHSATVVRRFSAEGVPLARWQVSQGGFGAYLHYSVAESRSGGVFVALYDHGLVRQYTKAGRMLGEWPVDGLRGPIATAPAPATAGTDVYVIAEVARGDLEVRGYDADGHRHTSFAVARSSPDLSIMPAAARDALEILVTEAPGSPDRISRYTADGAMIGGWETPIDMLVRGTDTDGPSGHAWLCLSPHWVAHTGELRAYTLDGTEVARCELPGDPFDVAIGRNGDLYVLAYAESDGDELLIHLCADCSPVDTWDLAHLNRNPELVPEKRLHLPAITLGLEREEGPRVHYPGSTAPRNAPVDRMAGDAIEGTPQVRYGKSRQSATLGAARSLLAAHVPDNKRQPGEARTMSEAEIGEVTHYFDRIGVAALALSAELRVGDTVRFRGHTTDFQQVIGSMQLDNAAVEQAAAGQEVGVKVDDRVRVHDKVYRLEGEG